MKRLYKYICNAGQSSDIFCLHRAPNRKQVSEYNDVDEYFYLNEDRLDICESFSYKGKKHCMNFIWLLKK